MKTLGEKIKIIRKMNKLNQMEFSSIIGVSQGTLSELEKDKYRPSVETIIALKLNFDIDLEWLLLEEPVNSNIGLFHIQIDEFELNLVSNLRKLNLEDKQEIGEIINLKLKRYNK
ncbi:transcriptional regulator [Paenibacillus polymyxa]|uniref:helix-turn-helix domain-containing protein n=1 Tax=Paenibacillus TaxID=44249 RepID=UPI00083DD9CE|nr:MULTISPECIES: helix-turn-helix transcriptional regulator [Paenibacillus]MCP3781569.1 helix-turn-helix domain-containing protein [Paenibacillus sp. MZ03-122A]ODB55028.1 transcriptional regulator [Paenibacillus polymyxa]